MLKPRVRALLYAHRKFLEGDKEAVCADFRGMNLSQMDFRKLDLRQANFSRTNMEGVDLRDANCAGANFSGANLHTAKVKRANFAGAILKRVFAAYVDFEGVNLEGADLHGADLAAAKMSGAIWGETPEAKLVQARFRITPDGDMIVWKKLRGGRLAKLFVPKNSKRSNGFGRRCRAEFVWVLDVLDSKGKHCEVGTSKRDPMLKYEVGKITKADDWDEDWKNDCSHGINFFLTREEAEAY